MANLDGIIPALPSGGQMSTRQQYWAGGNPNFFESAFDQSYADAANQAARQAGYGGPNLYKPGGYIYGTFDPNTQNVGNLQFSSIYDKQVAGGKIIPSQYTMTAAQSVGPAQFQMNGQTATAGQGNTSSPFTATAAAPAQQSPDPSANQPFLFGYNGDKGSIGGTFGSTQAGQASPFYQDQGGPFAMGSPQNLGVAGPVSPQVQALIQSR